MRYPYLFFPTLALLLGITVTVVLYIEEHKPRPARPPLVQPVDVEIRPGVVLECVVLEYRAITCDWDGNR